MEDYCDRHVINSITTEVSDRRPLLKQAGLFVHGARESASIVRPTATGSLTSQVHVLGNLSSWSLTFWCRFSISNTFSHSRRKLIDVSAAIVTVEPQQTHCLFANLKISISSYRLPHLRTPGHVITRNRTPIQPLWHYGHRRRVQLWAFDEHCQPDRFSTRIGGVMNTLKCAGRLDLYNEWRDLSSEALLWKNILTWSSMTMDSTGTGMLCYNLIWYSISMNIN